MFEALKSLSPKQRFLGFIIVVLISAVTSLGTAYMSGSDCTEVSDKYTKSVENYNKSIENYNKLVEITDDTQQKYMKAKEDIIIIQDKLNDILDMMGSKSNTSKSSTSSSSYENESLNSNGDGVTKGDTLLGTSPWSTPKKIIIKEKTIITKTEAPKNAKSMIDSLIKITKKYDKKK
jgi:hypothetical protein